MYAEFHCSIFSKKGHFLLYLETGAIVRDHRGLAVEAEVGQPGQVVGRLSKQIKFEGYTKESDTQKKIGRDIFAKVFTDLTKTSIQQ